jgi:hypothetical protein
VWATLAVNVLQSNNLAGVMLAAACLMAALIAAFLTHLNSSAASSRYAASAEL